MVEILLYTARRCSLCTLFVRALKSTAAHFTTVKEFQYRKINRYREAGCPLVACVFPRVLKGLLRRIATARCLIKIHHTDVFMVHEFIQYTKPHRIFHLQIYPRSLCGSASRWVYEDRIIPVKEHDRTYA